MKDWQCIRCGTRASAFGSYETCSVDGPMHDWEEMAEEGPISTEDDQCLRHTGMVSQEYERFMCGCYLCVPRETCPVCDQPHDPNLAPGLCECCRPPE